MAVTPEKIQRYRLDFQTMEAHNSTRMLPQSDGQLILYGDYLKAMKEKDTDHIRHLKLAQIAVLEELREHMRSRHANESNPTGSYCNQESLWIGDKIQKLRREIEG